MQVHCVWISSLDAHRRSASGPGLLTPGKIRGTHYTRDWAHHRGSSDRLEKSVLILRETKTGPCGHGTVTVVTELSRTAAVRTFYSLARNVARGMTTTGCKLYVRDWDAMQHAGGILIRPMKWMQTAHSCGMLNGATSAVQTWTPLLVPCQRSAVTFWGTSRRAEDGGNRGLRRPFWMAPDYLVKTVVSCTGSNNRKWHKYKEIYESIFSEKYNFWFTRINTQCGLKVELLNVKLAVHIVTTGLQRVKCLL